MPKASKFSLFTGSFFGAGYLPVAPGTWGSLFSLIPAGLALHFYPQFGIPLLVLLAMLMSLLFSDSCVKYWGEDPSQFVLDEFAGQSLTFLFITPFESLSWNIAILAAGFILFRFFDIAKPLGINSLQKLPGKFGILADDILAGIYASACLHIVIYLSGNI